MFKRLIPALIAVLFAHVVLGASSPTPMVPNAANAVLPAARNNLNINPTVSSMDPGMGGTGPNGAAVGDAEHAVMVACFTNNNSFCSGQAANVISFTKSGTVAAQLVVNAGSQTVSTGLQATAIISDGAGGSGTILNISATGGNGGFIGIGSVFTGTGVAAGQTVVGTSTVNSGACSPACTGTGTTGTYAVSIAQNLSSRTMTSGASFCTSEMAGEPVWIPVVGMGGPGSTGYYGRMTGCVGSQPSFEFGLEKGVAVASPGGAVTVSYGAQAINQGQGFLSSVNVGQGMIIGGFLGIANGGSPITITSVQSPTSIVVSANTTDIISNSAMAVVWGTDDSVPVSNACTTALARGLHEVQVPANHYTPSLSANCYQVILRGNGAILASDETMSAIASTAGEVRELVIPPWAPVPSPPTKAVIAGRDLTHVAIAGSAPTFVYTYDSVETNQPNGISSFGSYAPLLGVEYKAQNQGAAQLDVNCAIGGSTMANLDGNPNANSSLNCGPGLVTGSSWLSQIAALSPQPDLFTIGGGNNAGISEDAIYFLDVIERLRGVGGQFTKTPDVIGITHHSYSRLTNVPVQPDVSEFSAGIACSTFKVFGYPCVDGAQEGSKHIFGYDPLAMKLERRYDVPYYTTNMGLPYKSYFYSYGYSLRFGKSAVFGSTFWSSFTGGGGVTDPRGPFIAFDLGGHSGPENGNATLWLFYQSGSNTISIECDAPTQASNGMILPGVGCQDPATGKPPVTPSLKASITVANSGGGGVAVVTSSPAAFQLCVPGGAVAIPGAGAVLTPPGSSSYTVPLITTVSSCDSTSQMTLAVAAGTTYASRTGVIMFGNPLIATTITDIGGLPTGATTSEWLQVEVVGDRLRVTVNNQYGVLYDGPVIRPRNLNTINIVGGGNRPTITVWPDAVTGETTFQVPRRFPTVPDFVDAEVQGPPAGTPPVNQAFIGNQGGDGTNHNTEIFGQKIVQVLWHAQDMSVKSYSAPGTLTIASGCGTVGSVNGGATAGTFTTGQVACAPVFTLPKAAHGWWCSANDLSHVADLFTQTASTTTSCTLSATTTSGDTVIFNASAY